MKNRRKTLIRGLVILTSWAWFLSMSASAGPWWVTNSALKYREDIGADVGYALGGSCHYWNKDESDQFLFTSLGTVGTIPGALYSIPALRAALSSNDVIPIAFGTASSLYGTPAWKGGAVSDDLGRVLTGNSTANTNHASLPVTSPWTKDVTVFVITNTPNEVSFDGCDFSHTSEYLYSDNYNPSTTRSNIWKWNVGDLTNNGVGLTSNSVFSTSLARVRNVSVYYIGGKDLVYYGEGDESAATAGKVCVWDTVTSNETVLCDVGVLNTNDIMNVKAGGIGSGQMHLYVQHDSGVIEVLDLGADGKSATLVKTFSVADMNTLLGATWANMRCLEVTDDEEYAFIGFAPSNILNVVWSTAPGIAVLGTNGAVITNNEAASAANGTDFGSFTAGVAPVTNTLVVTNTGHGTLTISGWTTNGTGASSFAIAGIPATLAADTGQSFTVTFTPAAAGVFDAALLIANDATNYIVNLRGAVKQDQTITGFTPTNGASFPVTETVGLAATASSGLAVSFTNLAGSPVNWQNTTTITFSATGVVGIVASQTGNTDYAAAPDVTNAFNVTGSAAQTGTLSINVTPETGSWTLGGPTNYSGVTNGTGDLSETNVPVGTYSVAYGFLAGYRTPTDQTQAVTEGASVVFTGEYVVRQTPSDFGGEGCSDLAVYNPLTGQWYIWSPESGLIAWGNTLGGLGYEPVPGDYDGDGRCDLGVYNAGYWFAQSLDGTEILDGEQFGGAEFRPVAGDYDGDGSTDLTVYHEDTGYWYIRTVGGSLVLWEEQWGGPGFDPVAGDYTGNGCADLAVYHQASGCWYIQTKGRGEILYGMNWGWSGFSPVAGDYDGDGIADLAVYHEASGYWFILTLEGTLILWGEAWGGAGFTPVQGDYNADGISDLAVYYDGYWFVETVDGTLIMYSWNWGGEGYDPVGR